MRVKRNSVVHLLKGKFDISEGLSVEALIFVVHYYVRQRKLEAIETMVKFSEAGAKFYLYSLAGYKFKAEKPQSVPLLSDEVRQAISTNTVEQNTHVRHKEFNVLLSEDIVGFTEARVTKRKYYLTEKGKSLGFRTNKNGTILNPIGE